MTCACPIWVHFLQYVLRGQAPAPSTVGTSCVYVLRRPDGFFYVGSTDSLYDRIRAHRQARRRACLLPLLLCTAQRAASPRP